MGLKLFRTTGHSKLLDTRAAAAWQRSAFPAIATGRPPLSLVLAITAWVASVGNFPLWVALYHSTLGKSSALPPSFWGHVLLLGLGLWSALFVICAPLAFKRLVRPVLSLLLAASALYLHLYLLKGIGFMREPISTGLLLTRPASWLIWALAMGIAIGLPLIWLWRQRVMGMRMGHQLRLMVLWFLLAGGVLLVAGWMLSRWMPNDLLGMPVVAWINPVGLLLSSL